MNKKTMEDLIYLDETYLESAEEILPPKEKRILDYINRKIASMNSLKEMIDFLFEETQSIMPCDRIGVGFLDEDEARLSLYYVATNYSPLLLDYGYNAEIKNSSLYRIFESGQPRIINNLDEYAAQNPQSESTRLLIKEGVKSSMTCPLKVEERPVGLLFRSSKKQNAYSKKEMIMHLLIAERLSQAVEKAYRLEQVSSAFNSYMEMLSFVTHELKSPLDSIITMGNSMLAGYMGEIPEKQKNFIERINKKAFYLRNLTEEYLNLSRFESGKTEITPAKTDFIKDILEESIDIIKPQLTEKNITLEKDYSEVSLEADCEPELIKIVTVNFIGNAVKYGFENGTIKINASVKNEFLYFSVWNTGPGFSNQDKLKLFHKFSRLDKPELKSKKGTGVGLYVSWKIINMHKGSVQADSKEGEWAEFSFKIPLTQNIPDTK